MLTQNLERMSLKAVLFDFNGVVINDEAIHQLLVEEILLGENLRPSALEYQEVCLGRSDRACLSEILSRRGRVFSEDYLNKLMTNKAKAYKQQLEQLEELPLYSGLKELLSQLRSRNLEVGLVTGALRSEVELVLKRAELTSYFSIIVAGDDLKVSKPEPDGYLLAVERFNRKSLALQLQPANCLAIEDTMAGVEAAHRAGMQVVGVANTYPFQMLHRQADWVVDCLDDLELECVERIFSSASKPD